MAGKGAGYKTGVGGGGKSSFTSTKMVAGVGWGGSGKVLAILKGGTLKILR